MKTGTIGIMVLAAILSASQVATAGEETLQLVDGPGRDITSASCVTCHSLDYIQMNGPLMNRAAWERTLRKMIDRFGAPIEEPAARDILEYLSIYYSS